MKLKFLTVLSLTALLGAAGCGGGGSNTNTANSGTTNTGNATVTTATPVTTASPSPSASPAASPDTAVQKTVEDALQKKGITGVTVVATTTGVTLRGTVAKGRMTEAVRTAQEAGKKPVNNELTEAK